MQNFTRLHSISVIALVFLCLSGLSFIQFNWLQGAKVIREEKIQERLNKVMESFKTTLDLQLAENGSFISLTKPNQYAFTDHFISSTQFLIDSILHAENLDMPFEFGMSSCKTENYKWFSKPESEMEIRQGSQVKLGNCSFVVENGVDDHLHLFAIFPQRERLIFREMSLAIGSSILFMLLLAGAFAYTLFTIFRQKKLSEMKNDFINNLTHEFKTPIASISLAARTLKRLPPIGQSGKAMNYVNLIDQEGKRLENHIDKVLQMASMDSGSFALDKQEVNMHETIAKVKESLSLFLEKKGGEINLGLSAERPLIIADAMHLFNMLYNLVDNAIKYNNQRPQIFIDSKNTGEGLRISVRDNGIGMSKEVQEQVFNRFYRQKMGDARNVKGFGLGLAYVKRMMAAHGGRIELQSQPDQGTTFNLIFPKT